MNSRLLNLRPPRIAMTLLVLAAIFQWLVPIPSLEPLPLSAAVVGVGGFAIMIIAWWQFRQHSVAICPTAETTYLVRNGIYRWTRNPMYLGIAMMMVSVGLGAGSTSVLLAAVIFVAVIQWQFCPYEEEKLRTTFGHEYQQYAASVRRWL